MNICILGAGWFGCFIGDELIKKGYAVTIYEKEKSIFSNASGNNQNRLHLGFHYPRSFITRKLSIEGFKKFKKKLTSFSKKIKNNFYLIAKSSNSKISFKKYLSVMKYSKLKFKNINIDSFSNLRNMEGIVKCDEEVILLEKAKKYYKKKLKNNILYNREVKHIEKKNKKFIVENKKYDFVINCTWLQFSNKKIKNLVYEYCAIFLYKCKQKNHPAVTIMDGPFYTLYPWDSKNNFGLYSVKESRLLSGKNIELLKKKVSKNIDKNYLRTVKNKIETKYSYFYPEFKKNFKFLKYLCSYRTIIRNKDDSRACQIREKNNFIDILSGKIDHIFYALERVEQCLKKY